MNGRVEQYQGNIVGFSNRLNTILVPQSFMEWANRNFAPDEEAHPYCLLTGCLLLLVVSLLNILAIRKKIMQIWRG